MTNCARIAFGMFSLGLKLWSVTMARHGNCYVLGNLLRKVGDNIRCTDSESPVQHPQAEYKSVTRVAGVVLPFTPYKICGSISTLRVWHDSTNKNADKEACEDQETSDGFNSRERSVGIQNDKTTSPDADEIGYKHMPSLDLIVLVK